MSKSLASHSAYLSLILIISGCSAGPSKEEVARKERISKENFFLAVKQSRFTFAKETGTAQGKVLRFIGASRATKDVPLDLYDVSVANELSKMRDALQPVRDSDVPESLKEAKRSYLQLVQHALDSADSSSKAILNPKDSDSIVMNTTMLSVGGLKDLEEVTLLQVDSNREQIYPKFRTFVDSLARAGMSLNDFERACSL